MHKMLKTAVTITDNAECGIRTMILFLSVNYYNITFLSCVKYKNKHLQNLSKLSQRKISTKSFLLQK